MSDNKYSSALAAAEKYGLNFFSLDFHDFLKKNKIEDGFYHLKTAGLPLDFIFKRAKLDSDSFVLTFNGALSKKARSLNLVPNFLGVNMVDDLQMNLLAFADSSMYLSDEITIGWYLGDKDTNLQKLISQLLNFFASNFGISFCAFGGSGGGFASLYFLASNHCVKNALVWNCQTDISKYYFPFVKKYALTAFGVNVDDLNEFNSKIGVHRLTSLFDILSDIQEKRFVYLQNSSDWHLKNHAFPFFKKINNNFSAKDGFYSEDGKLFFSGEWGEGHVPPPKNLLERLLPYCLDDDLSEVKRQLKVLLKDSDKKSDNVVIINETIFCDNESDSLVLDVYFDRLLSCLRSIKEVDKSGFAFKNILYISSDKKIYIDRLKSIFGDDLILVAQIVEYQHPFEGYDIKESHPDRLKNPNKFPFFRDKLFEKAALRLDDYSLIIRVAIDDDDLWMPHQLQDIVNICTKVSDTSDYDANKIYAVGILNSFISYKNISGYEVHQVKMDRTLCGNKFLFSRNRELIKKWSPWSIPESIDFDAVVNFNEKYNVDLLGVYTNRPGFVYMRRGNNLSLQDKKWCIVESQVKGTFVDEGALITALKEELPSETFIEIAEFNRAIVAKVTCRIKDKKIYYDFNYGEDVLEVLGDNYAFYLYSGGGVLEKLSYSTRRQGYFKYSIPSGDFFVVCFLKRKNGEVIRIRSKAIRFK